MQRERFYLLITMNGTRIAPIEQVKTDFISVNLTYPRHLRSITGV